MAGTNTVGQQPKCTTYICKVPEVKIIVSVQAVRGLVSVGPEGSAIEFSFLRLCSSLEVAKYRVSQNKATFEAENFY